MNLPFCGDEEFGRLHAAVRLLLPILPALAASSPFVEGHPAAALDARMEFYRGNCRRIPSITARVVPESVFCEKDYRRTILDPMYRDIASLDPAGVLRHEWLNSRGAIARFDRGTIEIRVLGVQECPRADLAICAAAAAVLRALVEQRWAEAARQQVATTESLQAILLASIRDGDRAIIGDGGYLELLGFPEGRCTAGELWRH